MLAEVVIRWMAQNKLLALALAACLAMLVLLGIQTVRITWLQSTVKEQGLQLDTRNGLITSWRENTRLANLNRDAAQKVITKLATENDKLRDQIRDAKIPTDCKGAVEWARSEAAKVAGRWNR